MARLARTKVCRWCVSVCTAGISLYVLLGHKAPHSQAEKAATVYIQFKERQYLYFECWVLPLPMRVEQLQMVLQLASY